jgi:hypothetical protein
MKEKEWINGNHMKFESLHKTFNRQVDCITTGNVIGDVQLSSYIRPKSEVKCNGKEFEYGYLQERDLNKGIIADFPGCVKNWIRHNVNDSCVIAYEFRHWYKRRKIIHGYVITEGHAKGYKLKMVWRMGTRKRDSIIYEAIKYISNP